MQLISVTKLWNRAHHNAFTDLCEFNGKLFCCFREATNHISADGKIRVLTLDKSVSVSYQSHLYMQGIDLRDPKLSVTPEGKLLLIAFARHTNASNQTLHAKPICWFSSDGSSWSSATYFGHNHWWLWRVRWHQQQALGFAYNRTAQSIHLYKGNPRRTFEVVAPNALGLAKQGLGYPNESDICFTKNNTAYAIVRRDADSCSAQLGIAKPPYRKWQWQDLKEYIGGPCMLKINDQQALVAGRLWRACGPKTALWKLDFAETKLSLLHVLPSAGDTSYPGMVVWQDQLWLSYYSSHEQKTNIYLARFARA